HCLFLFTTTALPAPYPLSLHDALPISPHLSRGDIVIDGGNSNFADSLRRAEALQAKGIEFVDVGTSGGVWGLELGYCLMIGAVRSEEHTSELQSRFDLVCRLLLEKKKK